MSSAHSVHDELVHTLALLRRTEHSAVTLFARILREELFQSLGHATIELYGTEGLGLSLPKTRQFLRLARALDDLPATRTALDEGRLSWTKARTITAVATPRTEGRWIEAAASATSRELEQKVRQTKERNRLERDRLRRHRGQAAIVLPSPKQPPQPPPFETTSSFTLTLSPVEHGRLTSLLERLRKQGRREPRSALIMEGLAGLADNGRTREVSSAPYQIIGYRCDACNATWVDGRRVAQSVADAMSCDAVLSSSDAATPNRSSIPPSIRRAVLARDGHRCSTAGCAATRFLEVHHILPRGAGGSNEADNLTTLCSACHRFVHETASANMTKPGVHGHRAVAPHQRE